MNADDLIINEPQNRTIAATVILAHGAGAPMDSPFMAAMADGLAGRGVRCVRFEFPYMAERRASGIKKPPNRMPILLDAWRSVIEDVRSRPDAGAIVIGGKSMGGRVASMIAGDFETEDTPVEGVACLGYPFHPPGKPEKMRVDHLMTLKTPTLILQGSRDPFGTRAEVPDFGLPSRIRIEWLEDGDHGFKPRKASGLTEQENWERAVDLLAAFATNQAT